MPRPDSISIDNKFTPERGSYVEIRINNELYTITFDYANPEEPGMYRHTVHYPDGHTSSALHPSNPTDIDAVVDSFMRNYYGGANNPYANPDNPIPPVALRHLCLCSVEQPDAEDANKKRLRIRRKELNKMSYVDALYLDRNAANPNVFVVSTPSFADVCSLLIANGKLTISVPADIVGDPDITYTLE